MSTTGLHRLPSDELKRLLRALHRGALASPITRSSLIEKGFGNIEGHLDNVVSRDIESAKAMIAVVLAERASNRGASVELAYTGIAAPGTRSRDLLEQVRALLTSAVQRVEVVGLTLGADARGLVRTIAAVCDGRDLPGRLVFDTDGSSQVHDQLRDVMKRNFRRLEKVELWTNAPGFKLFVRAVIVDNTRALVTNGKLHAVEDDELAALGVLLQDPAYIVAWHKEWELLTRAEMSPARLVRVDLA